MSWQKPSNSNKQGGRGKNMAMWQHVLCNPMQAEDHDRLGRNMISIVGPKPNPEELFNCRTLVSLFLWADVPPTVRAPIFAHESWVSLKITHDSCAKIGVRTVGVTSAHRNRCFFIFPFEFWKRRHKNLIHFPICARHPCAKGMLLFSASFQFYRMLPEGNP